MTPSALRGHPRVNLQLRAFATEATVADGEGRRLSVPGPPGSGTGRDSKEPIVDMSAVESRENRDGVTVPISWTGRKFGASPGLSGGKGQI